MTIQLALLFGITLEIYEVLITSLYIYAALLLIIAAKLVEEWDQRYHSQNPDNQPYHSRQRPNVRKPGTQRHVSYVSYDPPNVSPVPRHREHASRPHRYVYYESVSDSDDYIGIPAFSRYAKKVI